MLHKGGSIGYWQGEIPKVLDDIMALRPTLFCGVPRVFDRIYAGINEQVSRRPQCSNRMLCLVSCCALNPNSFW